MMTIAVVSFQWFFWGFSLTFSETGSKFIGDLSESELRVFNDDDGCDDGYYGVLDTPPWPSLALLAAYSC